MARKLLLTGILLLPLGSMAWATEPPAPAAPNKPAASFDLKSAAVQNILRATVATQVSTTYRVEPESREKPDLAASLRVDRPVPAKPDEPRLPERTRCNGFLSCGVETLLGLTDDEELYARRFRERLMNQGSITNPEVPGP